MKNRWKYVFAVLATLVLGLQAELITGVTIESVSSEVAQYDRYGVNLVNGSGLTGGEGTALDTHDTTPGNGMWLTNGKPFSPKDLHPEITFNLGGLYDVNTVRIWNYNEAGFTKHGANQINISAGATLESLTQTLTINVAQGGGTATEAAQDFASNFTNVQFVKFTIISNHDGDNFETQTFTGSPEEFAGLSEIRFETGIVVPPVNNQAINPIPATLETELEPSTTILTWDANDPDEEVSEFQILIGVGAPQYNYMVNSNSVARGASETHSYTPPANIIQTGGPYWWRVDKVTADGTIAGKVWTFTTRNETAVEKNARMDWFRNDKLFGAIVWGLYSGAEGVWPAQTGTKIPGSTYAEWMQSWADLDTLTYRDTLEPFLTGEFFDAAQQAKLCKDAGMTMVYVMPRHHDGYAIWDTQTSTILAPDGFKIGNSAYNPTNRDYLMELVTALRAEGLKVGFYFSLGDWHHPDFPHNGTTWAHPKAGQANPEGHTEVFANYVNYLYQQVQEIVDPNAGSDYGLFDAVYFDYSSNGINGEGWGASKLVHLVRKHNPNVIINNRLWLGVTNPKGDYATPEANVDNVTYGQYADRDWEAIMSANTPPTWGYGRPDLYPFKTASNLVWNVIEVVAKGGLIELSVSPKGDGSLHPDQLSQYAGLGAWMDANEESVRGTTGNPVGIRPAWGEYTAKQDQNRLYMHVFSRPADGNIVAEELYGNVKKAWLLTDPAQTLTVTPLAEGFQINLPVGLADPINTVIVVDYEFPKLPITTTTVVDFSSENVLDYDRAAIHTVDSSGLTASTDSTLGKHALGENGIVWTTGGSLGPKKDYDPYITFDLGDVYDVRSIHEWGYNGGYTPAGKDPVTFTKPSPDAVDVYTSVDGINFTFAETLHFAEAPGANGYVGHEIAVDYPGVRYIKLDIMTTHDGAIFGPTETGANGGADGRSLTGLSEIRFGMRGNPVTDLGISRPIIGSTGMEISWTGEKGKPYAVETNSNLLVGNWQPYITGLIGNGDLLSITVTNNMVPERTFYRVISE